MKDLKDIFFPEIMLSDCMFLNFLQVGHFQMKRSANLGLSAGDAVHESSAGAGHHGLEDASTGQERSCCIF